MQDVAFNMLFAGHDTTASALTLMMLYLKQEPRVLQKVRDEQHQVTYPRPKPTRKWEIPGMTRGPSGVGGGLQGWCGKTL